MRIFSEVRRAALIEASYEADTKARAEALKVWKGIESYASSGNAAYVSTRLHRGEEGLLLSHGKAGLPSDLDVKFGFEPGSRCIYDPGARPPYTIELGKVLDAPRKLRVSDSGLWNARAHFVHEYIHYLDYKRSFKGRSAEDRLSAVGRVVTGPGGEPDYAPYIQSPMEFNAFYQEVADVVIGRVEEKETEEDLDWVREYFEMNFSSFAKFQEMVDSLVEFELGATVVQILRAMQGSKWARKWVVRLHGLYVELRDRLKKVLEGD